MYTKPWIALNKLPFKLQSAHFDVMEMMYYREGMRLTISFLRHSDLFGPNANYTGQIVRVDRIEDGLVGVAVRLVGLT